MGQCGAVRVTVWVLMWRECVDVNTSAARMLEKERVPSLVPMPLILHARQFSMQYRDEGRDLAKNRVRLTSYGCAS